MLIPTHLAEEGVRPTVEVPLLGARLSASRLGEGVEDLVGVDQILVPDRIGVVTPRGGPTWKREHT